MLSWYDQNLSSLDVAGRRVDLTGSTLTEQIIENMFHKMFYTKSIFRIIFATRITKKANTKQTLRESLSIKCLSAVPKYTFRLVRGNTGKGPSVRLGLMRLLLYVE